MEEIERENHIQCSQTWGRQTGGVCWHDGAQHRSAAYFAFDGAYSLGLEQL
jgi:hypothetical protein